MKKFCILFSFILHMGCATAGINSASCEGNCSNGTGNFTWENGSSYSGQWKNGRRDGVGKYRYPNGSIYEGEWIDDKKDGKGSLWIFENGKLIGKYTGTWKDDEMHGIISLYDENDVLLQKLHYFHGKNIGSSEK